MDRVHVTACLALLVAAADAHGTDMPAALPSVRDISLTLDNDVDPVLNIANLERARRFILDQGFVMMTNRYANVPCYKTGQFTFTLHPNGGMRSPGDLRGWPGHSFTTLDIVDRETPADRAARWTRDRRSSVGFAHEHVIDVRTGATDPGITVADLYALPVDGLADLLDIVDGVTSARAIELGGNCAPGTDESGD